jgi:hypothetical protein
MKDLVYRKNLDRSLTADEVDENFSNIAQVLKYFPVFLSPSLPDDIEKEVCCFNSSPSNEIIEQLDADGNNHKPYFVFGISNYVDVGVVFGASNHVEGGVCFGIGNQVKGSFSFCVGDSNNIFDSLCFGSHNEFKEGVGLGCSHIKNTTDFVVDYYFGQYNDLNITEDMVMIYGNGTTEDSRSNLFEL